MLNSKKLELFFYDTNVGEYDEYNPRYVRDKYGIQEILYVISDNPPYSLSYEDIKNKLDIDVKVCKDALDSLIKINAVSVKNYKYKINFPAFLEKDIDLLGNFNIKAAKLLGEKVISLKDDIDVRIAKMSCYKNCDIKALRYHIIGCATFDGAAMDYFTNRGIITTSKPQPGDRDYLLIGYEKGEKTLGYSLKLLCSCNNIRTDNVEFCSFGDADGDRKDMMSFFRSVQKNLEKATIHNDLNMAYIKLNEYNNRCIVEKCEKLLFRILKEPICCDNLNEEEKNLAVFLKELGCFDFKDEHSDIKCIVPVFSRNDEGIIEEISNFIMINIYEIVKNTIETLDKSMPDLTSIKHGVEARDIANELWHLMFGATNEYLVRAGFYAEPEYKKGEGRYLRCLYIE